MECEVRLGLVGFVGPNFQIFNYLIMVMATISCMSHFFSIYMIFGVRTPYDSSFVNGQYVWTFSCSISTEGA